MKIVSALLIGTILGFIFIGLFQLCEKGYYKCRNRVRDNRYCKSHYFIVDQTDTTQLVSFDGGTNWTVFTDGIAIASCVDPKVEIKSKSYRWYKENIKSMSGCTQDVSYRMRSIDGGRHWAYYDRDTGALIGECSSVTNEALKEAWGWHVLTEYAMRRGPINPLTDSKGLAMLNDVGITVTTNGVEL